MDNGLYAVIDIGKTVSKLSLWGEGGLLLKEVTRANEKLRTEHYDALDAENIEIWLFENLLEFSKIGQIVGIIPVAHGAAAAIIKLGSLALLPMDYESEIPAEIMQEYSELRDEFEINLSPKMEKGLNLGAQLYFLKKLYPALFESNIQILTWAQYWAFVFSGAAFCEITSMGAHTDLWSIKDNKPSPMATKLGIAQKLAPFRAAYEIAGPVRKGLVARLGISENAKVYVGIHDSNAALHLIRNLPQLKGKEICVVSTGTWFVLMRALSGHEKFDLNALDESKSLLANIDTYSRPVPTALFMGGREIEMLNAEGGCRIDLVENQAALFEALRTLNVKERLIFPSITPGIGPFATKKAKYDFSGLNEYEIGALVALYAAMVTVYCLDLLDAPNNIILDGRFAHSDIYTYCLNSISSQRQFHRLKKEANLALGALLLIGQNVCKDISINTIPKSEINLTVLFEYWKDAISSS